jgi:hypothetical protein
MVMGPMVAIQNKRGASNDPTAASDVNAPTTELARGGSGEKVPPRSPSRAPATIAAPSLAGAPKLRLPPHRQNLSLEQRPDEVLRVARRLFEDGPHWVDFFALVLGPDGLVDKLFPKPHERLLWEESVAAKDVQEILSALRTMEFKHQGVKAEPERMITIRIPESVHRMLLQESDRHDVSVNKLCISKLVQSIDQRLIPEERGRRRGRRPGPQSRTAAPPKDKDA